MKVVKVAVVLLALNASACRKPVPVRTEAVAPPGHVVIVHTNDIHAHFLPNRAAWLDGKPEIGGFVAIDSWVHSIENANRTASGGDAVLYLDAGDLLTGTPLMQFTSHGAKGGAMLDFLHLADCDGWVIGNHDFDEGYDNLAAMTGDSPMPAMSANLHGLDGGPPLPNVTADHVYEVNGVKVGVFGLTTEGLGHLVSAADMARIRVESVEEAARREVKKLDPKVDVVVALTHLGFDADKKLAADVDGIDLIVGGHSHTSLAHPVQVNRTYIVQAGSYARQLGVVEIDVENGELTDLEGRLVDLHPDELPLPPDPEMVELVNRYQKQIDEAFAVQVGTVAKDLVRSPYGESPMGRWAADMVRTEAKADIGLFNGGGLRADLVAGPLTKGELYQVFPFSNRLVTFTLTGEQLVGVLLKSAAIDIARNRSPLLWSGVHFTWHLKMGAPELGEVTVDGEPLQLERTYTVATNSYIVEQWRYHLGFEPTGVKDTGMTVFQAALDAARSGPLAPPDDARSVRVEAER